jgi:hypothetical protein
MQQGSNKSHAVGLRGRIGLWLSTKAAPFIVRAALVWLAVLFLVHLRLWWVATH